MKDADIARASAQKCIAPRCSPTHSTRALFQHAPHLRLALVFAAAPATAFAHHGIINFDVNREVEFSGTVARLRFVNPHSWLHVDVTTADGRVEAWKCSSPRGHRLEGAGRDFAR